VLFPVGDLVAVREAKDVAVKMPFLTQNPNRTLTPSSAKQRRKRFG
jgi:hypothetical protein